MSTAQVWGECHTNAHRPKSRRHQWREKSDENKDASETRVKPTVKLLALESDHGGNKGHDVNEPMPFMARKDFARPPFTSPNGCPRTPSPRHDGFAVVPVFAKSKPLK